MREEATDSLGELLSEHGPSSGLGRGYPAHIGAGGLLLLAGIGCGYWAITGDDGPSLELLGGAVVVGVVGAISIRSGFAAMRSRVFMYDDGMIIRTAGAESVVRWEDVDAWTVFTCPGITNRYEEDFANVYRIEVSTSGTSIPIPDQLEDFRAIHDALSEQAPVPRRVVRTKTRLAS